MVTKKTFKACTISNLNIINSTGAGIYWKDKQGRYIGCNAYFASLAGLLSPEDIQKKIDLTLPWKSQSNLIQQHDNLVIKNSKPLVTNETWQINEGATHTFIVNRTPLYDDNNKLIGLIATMIDTTPQNTITPAEQSTIHKTSGQKKLAFYADLVKEIAGEPIENMSTEVYTAYIYEYLEKIIACMPGNVYWLNKNGIFLGCNDNVAKMLGLSSPMDIIGMTHKETAELAHWSAGQAESFEKDDKDVIKTGIPKINIEEPPITDVHGRKIFFLTNRVPLKNANNDVISVIGISIDITDRKNIEMALQIAKNAAEAANQAKTEFMANMSHDIRTPLTGAAGMSQTLEDDLESLKQKQYAHWIDESGDQLLHMLNGLLDEVSADKINETDLHEELFNVRDIVDDILQLERPSTLLKGLEFIIHVDDDIPPCLISDSTKLHRIILNLLDNAIKFTKEGHVKLDVSLIDRKHDCANLRFQISDTGIGISPDMQSMVFDRFFRVTPSYKGVYTGSGVGLHIAQSYAHLLGGDIKLTSELGVGTTFSFDLSFQVGDISCVPVKPKASQKPATITTPSAKITTTFSSVDDPVDLSQIYLTKKEIECIQWMIKGKSASDIATILHASPRTIETHLNNIKRKLNSFKQFQLGYLFGRYSHLLI